MKRKNYKWKGFIMKEVSGGLLAVVMIISMLPMSKTKNIELFFI